MLIPQSFTDRGKKHQIVTPVHPHFSVWPFAVGICANSLPSFCSFSSNWALDLVSSLHVPVVKVCPVFPPSCPVSSSSMCPVPELSCPPQPPSPCAATGLVPWKCSLKSARPPSPHSDLGTMSALLGDEASAASLVSQSCSRVRTRTLSPTPPGHSVDAGTVPSLHSRNFQGIRARKWRLKQTHRQ